MAHIPYVESDRERAEDWRQRKKLHKSIAAVFFAAIFSVIASLRSDEQSRGRLLCFVEESGDATEFDTVDEFLMADAHDIH